jgi:2-haloacid dehalogenase
MANPDPDPAPLRPAVIVFDVNETLSDMAPIADRFADIGAPPGLARTWFAGLLRDGFALTAVGASRPFATLAHETLRILFGDIDRDRPVDAAVAHVLDGFASLQVHPDVDAGTRSLHDLGIRLVTLSNGSADVARSLLDRAGIADRFEAMLSVDDAGIWKPAPGAYAHALRHCNVAAADAMLVAVHPWDTDGAARAGLQTAYIDRSGTPYPMYFRQPDVVATSLPDLADQLR